MKCKRPIILANESNVVVLDKQKEIWETYANTLFKDEWSNTNPVVEFDDGRFIMLSKAVEIIKDSKCNRVPEDVVTLEYFKNLGENHNTHLFNQI